MSAAESEVSELHDELRAVVRQVIVDRCPSQAVRKAIVSTGGVDEKLWVTMAELGWLGLEVPEEHGGAGMSFAELAVVLEELGRGFVPTPFLGSVVLGTGAILAAGTEDQQATWLPPLARGDRRLTVALGGESGSYDAGATGSSLTEHRGALVLSGTVSYVPDAHHADAIVVEAVDGAGISLVLVPIDAEGVDIVPQSTFDQTRRLATVRLDAVNISPTSIVGERGAARPIVDWLLDRAAVALALDCAGGCAAALELSLAYAKDRVQFDRPIGSFQAIKHRCADMFVAAQTARAAARAAARELGRATDERTAWPAIAKSHAGDAYAAVAGGAIDVHGGIGFTWEHDAHLLLKRAKLNQALYGSSAWHRDRIVTIRAMEERTGRRPSA